MHDLNLRPQIGDGEVLVWSSVMDILADDTLRELLLQDGHLDLLDINIHVLVIP